jgi:hypothetical protein
VFSWGLLSKERKRKTEQAAQRAAALLQERFAALSKVERNKGQPGIAQAGYAHLLVRPNDAATLFAVGLLMSLLALVATYLPARRR